MNIWKQTGVASYKRDRLGGLISRLLLALFRVGNTAQNLSANFVMHFSKLAESRGAGPRHRCSGMRSQVSKPAWRRTAMATIGTSMRAYKKTRLPGPFIPGIVFRKASID